MKELGTEMLIMTGGEQLLRKDIFEIASRASARGLWVVMGTNGVLLDDRVAAKMVECGIKGIATSRRPAPSRPVPIYGRRRGQRPPAIVGRDLARLPGAQKAARS
jgi:MoaA/NifB/PqqE/SkfB family radical SAM enzyme